MNLVVNFRIHHADGSLAHYCGAFESLSGAIARAGESFEADDGVVRVDVRGDFSDPDRPIRTLASVTAE